MVLEQVVAKNRGKSPKVASTSKWLLNRLCDGFRNLRIHRTQ